jgi:hypothetical protein
MSKLETRKSKLTFETASTVWQRGRRRPVVIQAEPDYARVRLKGTRSFIDVSWEGIYAFAAKVQADRNKRERLAAKPSKKVRSK